MTTIPTSKRIHPLVAAAAISVMLVSLVGVAAITGIIPNSYSSAASETVPVTAAAEKPAVATPASAPILQTAQTSQAPVHKTHKPAQQAVAHAQQICTNCGVVESVEAVQQKAEHGSGVGAVTGALLGGVIGNQVGGGNGRKLATVAGAVGGGFAGNEVERRAKSTVVYHVRVRLEDGNVRTFTPSGEPGWQVGDRVRIVNGHLASRA